MNRDYIARKRCRRCKKEMFFPHGVGEWAYRDGSHLYCSYACMQEYRRMHPNDSRIACGRKRYLFSLDKVMRYFEITTLDLAQVLGISEEIVKKIRTCNRYAEGAVIDTLCDLFGCTEFDLASAEKPAKERMRLWEIKWECFDEANQK